MGSSKKKSSSKKGNKSQRKQDLRQRNLGIGIGKISVDGAEETTKTTTKAKKIATTPVARLNKKITFDDDFVASDYESSNENEKDDENNQVNNDADANSDANADADESSDDEMEQISASTAKQQALDLMAAERKTRREESALSQKRKRKAKAKPKKKDEEKKQAKKKKKQAKKKKKEEDENSSDDELDEDFFAMVDQERKDEVKMKKRIKKGEEGKGKVKLGKHTTFVSVEDDPNKEGSMTKPIVKDHNIEVVVLPTLRSEEGGEDDNKDDEGEVGGGGGDTDIHDPQQPFTTQALLSATLGTKPSNTALMFCRGNQTLKERSKLDDGCPIKRSRKMKYRPGIPGKPLCNFANANKKRHT